MTAVAGRTSAGVFASVLAAAVLAAATLAGQQTRPSPPATGEWHLIVLGIAQDGGIPHLGCEQEICRSIREGRRKPERVASLGLLNTALGKAYLFDATPDFKSQLQTLTGGHPPDGIFLTHGHIGHYTGLMYLGRESIDAQHVPVYGTEKMKAYLTTNGPWSLLVSRGNIDLQVVEPDHAGRARRGDSRHGVHGAASRRVHRHRRLSHRGPAQESAVHSRHRSVAEVVARHP